MATQDITVKSTNPCGVDGCEKVPPKPEGVDLDVTYISRTPMYNRYQVEYTKNGEPYLAEGTENDQRWPKQGELVTFTAHIMNKGTDDSGAFTFHWLIDDQMMMSGEHPSLPAGFEITVSFEWEWSHPLDGERLLESHTVGFWVDPDDQIQETYELNNQLEDRTDASSLALLITPEVYQALEKPISSEWSYSAEDWLQRQITAMNSALEASVYNSAPHGVLERVRLDKIIITENNQTVNFSEDGQFFITEDLRYEQGYYDYELDVSGWLLHELSHLLGVIDIYKMDVPLETVQVRDRMEQPVQMEFIASVLYGGMMSDPGIKPLQYDEHTALALNLN
ncbi:MAG: CARDB domain-containing protein, partial [Anaerolineaceae bacterium]